MTRIQAKHTQGPWVTDGGTHVQATYSPSDGGKPFYHTIARTDQPLVSPEQQGANARLIASAPLLLAFAECEAAVACGKADPRYDPKPVLISHGWNEQTESAGLFLARIRRKAVESATGFYLGRAA